MKNGKNPALPQMKLMKSHGLIPDNWLVVKDIRDFMEPVGKRELKKICTKKVRTRKLFKRI